MATGGTPTSTRGRAPFTIRASVPESGDMLIGSSAGGNGTSNVRDAAFPRAIETDESTSRALNVALLRGKVPFGGSEAERGIVGTVASSRFTKDANDPLGTGVSIGLIDVSTSSLSSSENETGPSAFAFGDLAAATLVGVVIGLVFATGAGLLSGATAGS